MTQLVIQKTGFGCTLQDLGRFDYGGIGLTTGGVADKVAYYWANRILGNQTNASLIEVTIGGMVMVAKGNLTLCITGADVAVTVNDKPVRMWSSFHVRPDDVIRLGHSQTGMRIYVGIAGGVLCDQQFGSVSTVVREGVGGLNGRQLQQGELLTVAEQHIELQGLPFKQVPRYSQSVILRYVPSYQYQQFSRQQINTFEQQVYQVTEQSDRMGYRLLGNVMNDIPNNLVSEGICLGAIQIPPDGQPIVLLNDRQTLGGYPKIGAVLSLDIYKLAQCRAKAKVKFEPISHQEALLRVREFWLQLQNTMLMKVVS